MSTDETTDDLRTLWRRVTQPAFEALDHRLQREIARRVDETVAERLADLERAVAELTRRVDELSAD
jgi:uncharacterized protein YceH (UPF0502 family)